MAVSADFAGAELAAEIDAIQRRVFISAVDAEADHGAAIVAVFVLGRRQDAGLLARARLDLGRVTV